MDTAGEGKTQLTEWLNGFDFNVAQTLTWNKQVSLEEAERTFNSFLARQDRDLFGRQFATLKLGTERCFALGVIEFGYESSNTHIHLSVQVPNGRQAYFMKYAKKNWKHLVLAGSAKSELIWQVNGWHEYISKHLERHSVVFVCKGKFPKLGMVPCEKGS